MQTSCIVGSHYAGLFSLINKVMVCLAKYDQVHVDFSKGDRCLYGPKGVNLWNYLFHPTEPCEGEIIEGYPDSSITSVEVSALYGTMAWRHLYHEQWKKVTVREEIIRKAYDFTRQWQGRHVVSVLVRATTHCSEQVDNRTQSLEEYSKAICEVMHDDTIVHVMACDEETIRWFQQRFPTVTYYPLANRTMDRDIDIHLNGQSVHDARECLSEVLILSQSDVLIHPVSNLSTAALYINPKLESVYLR